MTHWDFACSDPVDISIDSWASGGIVVSGEPTATIAVDIVPSHRNAEAAELARQVEVSFEDGQLAIRGPQLSSFRRRRGLELTVKAPSGSTCSARTASADVTCVGDVSGLSVRTASGDVTAPAVSGDVTVQSASGDVLLDTVGGEMTISTASGDIRARQADGAAKINTASGDVTLGYCAGDITVSTASGDIDLEAVAEGTVELRSVSGDLSVGVVPGIGVYLDLSSTSGSLHNGLDAAGEDEHSAPSDASVQISCRSLSGDIRVHKASGVTRPQDSNNA